MLRMTTSALKVLVVEDNPFTRTTLCGALENEGVRVVASVDSAARALEAATRLQPDAALIDLDLGDGPSGADFAAEVRRLIPRIGIVILTSYEDPRLAGEHVKQLPTNARYMIKRDLRDARALVETLARAVESAREERGPEVPIQIRSHGATARLTDTQVEIMRLVADGLSNHEIARRRFVSDKAVERMLMRIAQELDIPTDSTTNRRVLMTRAYLRMAGSDDA